MKPIYEPRGAAKEYGDLAINIYTGCPHRCYYCFAPNVLRRDREKFHSCVEPRRDIVEATRRQIERENITGKLIHLCFTCDPYPTGYDNTATREIIKVIKESGNNVQILTKGNGSRDFDLLNSDDWYGVTISNASGNGEKGAIPPIERLSTLYNAKKRGIKTWVSFEPVLDIGIIEIIKDCCKEFDKIKVGKLNYHPSNINWGEFGRSVESICQRLGANYYIKDSLREEMNK